MRSKIGKCCRNTLYRYTHDWRSIMLVGVVVYGSHRSVSSISQVREVVYPDPGSRCGRGRKSIHSVLMIPGLLTLFPGRSLSDPDVLLQTWRRWRHCPGVRTQTATSPMTLYCTSCVELCSGLSPDWTTFIKICTVQRMMQTLFIFVEVVDFDMSIPELASNAENICALTNKSKNPSISKIQ